MTVAVITRAALLAHAVRCGLSVPRRSDTVGSMSHAAEIADLVGSFTTKLEEHIDGLVKARLAELFARLDVRDLVTAPASPRRALAAPRVGRRPAAVARPSAPPLVRSQPTALPPSVIELPKPKQATVIPADFKITRLPPGPSPRQGTYSELRSRCRVPGCLEKNSGPRYDLMCRDHYAKLNAEERQKYKAMWKAAHTPQPAA